MLKTDRQCLSSIFSKGCVKKVFKNNGLRACFCEDLLKNVFKARILKYKCGPQPSHDPLKNVCKTPTLEPTRANMWPSPLSWLKNVEDPRSEKHAQNPPCSATATLPVRAAPPGSGANNIGITFSQTAMENNKTRTYHKKLDLILTMICDTATLCTRFQGVRVCIENSFLLTPLARTCAKLGTVLERRTLTMSVTMKLRFWCA